MACIGKNGLTVRGVAASYGIAYGQTFLYLENELEIPRYSVDPGNRVEETALFEQALVVTRRQIAEVQQEVRRNLSEEEAIIFDVHQCGSNGA